MSLLEGDFDRIWAGFASFGALKASSQYACRSCGARYYCDVCPGEMELLYGDAEHRPVPVCKPAKIRQRFYQGEIGLDEALRLASLEGDEQRGGDSYGVQEA